MRRRQFIQGLTLLGGCAACAQTAIASSEGARWSYAGDRGPSRWGSLSPEYRSCSTGTQQSPVNIEGAIFARLEAVAPRWKVSDGTVANNGHTIQFDLADGGELKHDGSTYQLLQFHFHAPSEHQIDGKAYPMEVHFVHRDPKTGNLAVLGVFMDAGAENEGFGTLAASFPDKSGTTTKVKDIDPAQLLPQSMSYFTYAGSLTTPPCSEIVTWLVAEEPVAVRDSDIAHFTALYAGNARPIAPLNRRLLLRSAF